MGAILRNNVVYSGGGGSSDIKELTLAEYNALSEEEKNNGTVYLVPDAIVVGEDVITLDVVEGVPEVSYTDEESVRQTIQLANKESVDALDEKYVKGGGLEFTVEDGILCAIYDDGEEETTEGSEV